MTNGSSAVVKDEHINEHEIYLLAFAESSVDHQWDTAIFCDKYTFSSSNNGFVFI
jgi:hypothetical protein